MNNEKSYADRQNDQYRSAEDSMSGGLKQEASVYVDAEFKDGQIVSRKTGKPLPFNDGDWLQLKISQSKAQLLGLDLRPSILPFLPKETPLFYGIQAHRTTHGAESSWIWDGMLVKRFQLDPNFPIRLSERDGRSEYMWTEIKLRENLWLSLRGDKEAKLLPAVVYVPGSERQFPSLNSAVTACVREMQSKRLSTSTNVFRNCIANIAGMIYTLELLRRRTLRSDVAAVLFEDELFFDPRLRLRCND